MSTPTKHIPAPGRASGMHGTALCGRQVHYLTGDYALIQRLARADGSGYCRQCLAKLRWTGTK